MRCVTARYCSVIVLSDEMMRCEWRMKDEDEDPPLSILQPLISRLLASPSKPFSHSWLAAPVPEADFFALSAPCLASAQGASSLRLPRRSGVAAWPSQPARGCWLLGPSWQLTAQG